MKTTIKITLFWVLTFFVSNEINAQGSQKMYAWGSQEYGQLGNGFFSKPPTPTAVDHWLTVVAGVYHTLAINSNGELYAWGNNYYGQLGLGNTTNQSSPQRVGSASNWTSVVAGEYHTLAINSTGELYAWGRNNDGQLGLGNTTNQSSPQRVGSASNWTLILAVLNHTLTINSNGELYAWGNNDYGQLGIGNTTNQSSPQRVGSASNWMSVAGTKHILAINSNGELYAWGNNDFGQLGLGTTTNQSSPQRVGSASNWISVAAGGSHTLAIKSSGELYAWGNNYYGQLGLGNTTNQSSPQRVGSAINWTSVAAGGFSHTLAINSNGEIYTWGWNGYGQLGIGNSTNQSSPQRVGSASNWTTVVAGAGHTLAINSNGELYAWGNNSSCQLGLGNTTNQNSPQQVSLKCSWNKVSSAFFGYSSFAINSNGELFACGNNNMGQLGLGNTTEYNKLQRVGNSSDWVQVVSADAHTLALNSNGEIYAWGYNGFGQLGLGNTINQTTPQRVGSSSDWVSLTTGHSMSFAINSNGELYAWGNNSIGQLGLGNTTNFSSPQQVGSASNWIFVTAGINHVIAINSSGELYAWGGNDNGQLGLGNTTNQSSPQQVGSTSNWSSASVGGYHTVAVNTLGELFAWGLNDYGQLGLGNNTSYNTPQQIGSASNWSSVTCDTRSNVALKTNGEMYSWGLNNYGQLGLGDNVDRNNPTKIGYSNNWNRVSVGSGYGFALNSDGVLFVWGDNNYGQLGFNTKYKCSPQRYVSTSKWKSVAAGHYHNLVINSSGELYAWGRDDYGTLGLGNTINQNSPQRVGTNSNWTTIVAGNGHTLAINSSGELYSWGINNYGQLGLGNTKNQSTPQRVGSASNWKLLAAGQYHTLAINSNGELFAWGLNSFGQLGLGNTSNQSTPQRVGSASNWTSIAAGGAHTLAINSSGELYAWGMNFDGPLGLGNTTHQSTPQRVGSASNWTSIAAGSAHSLAIKSSGELYTWGRNDYGQLGLGNTNNQSSPLRVGSSINWKSLASGLHHSLAINSSGELYAWGLNNYGQLGLGNTSNQSTPQRVGSASNWTSVVGGNSHTIAFESIRFIWSGTDSINSKLNWSEAQVPSANDSTVIRSGIMTVNQTTYLDVMTIIGGSTVKLTAPLTLRNLYINNGTIDLNGHRLTITGGIYQSTDSTNYFIQAGTLASPKPRSELAIMTITASNSTMYFNPNANRLNKFEIGNGSVATQITLGNSVKIKGGEDGGNGPGLLTVNKNAKILIPSGSTLTLESDTFNAGLSLAQPAQRSIMCQGTGKFNIERDHYGVRGWRLYSHPFKTDIDLQEVANDIELIGPGGTSEGFYSNTYTNTAAYWYDYSKADSGATTDPAWTEFTSAKGSTISGNTNKWKKNSPLLLFNPGNRRGTDAFGSPSTATYEQGKIVLSYTLDSTAIHLNDGITQTISTGVLPSTSKYFFITNPFTMPVRLSKIEGLNSSNVDPYFYYWKQRRNTVTDNFSPAEWQAEKIVTGTAARDSNISIPAFGTILVRLKNSSTTFSIPESAKQLTNFSYIIGGAKGTSKTGLMFADITGSNLGPNSLEIKLLVKDSLEADRVLVYDEQNQSSQYTTSDARKFVNPDFPNLFTYSQDGKPLALDMQDIAEQLNSGKSEVEIPLGIEREIDKRYARLNLQMSENNMEYLIALKDKTTGKEMQLQTLKTYPVEFKSEEISIGRYSLIFRRATNSLKDIVTSKNTTASGSQSTQSGIFLYPNPASNQLYITTNQGEFRGTVEICDLLGRVVLSQTYAKENPLNISKLQAGSYFVKTSQGTQLFIKE